MPLSTVCCVTDHQARPVVTPPPSSCSCRHDRCRVHIAGVVMSAVVILSRKCHINPDNVATPIAASLGDLTTLALLSSIATVFYKAVGKWRGVYVCVYVFWSPRPTGFVEYTTNRLSLAAKLHPTTAGKFVSQAFTRTYNRNSLIRMFEPCAMYFQRTARCGWRRFCSRCSCALLRWGATWPTKTSTPTKSSTPAGHPSSGPWSSAGESCA